MTLSTFGSYGSMVKEFLCNPLNRKTFDRFFKTCHYHTKGYLRYLKIKGFQLPLDHKTNGDPITDLAYVILGTFLQRGKDRPFPVVFDYFEKVGLADPKDVDPDELYHHFTVLLRGHIKQQISRLKGEQDPQTDHLKRRFKELLKEPDFMVFRANPDSM